MDNYLDLDEVIDMESNIDKKPGFKLAGLFYKIDKRDKAAAIRKDFCDKYWEKGLRDFGAFTGLMTYNALDNSYEYFLGFEISDESVIDDLDFEIRQVDEALYYEALVDGLDLESSYKYVYEKFFPNKKYFHGLGPDVEFYQFDEANNEIGKAELYICLRENPHV